MLLAGCGGVESDSDQTSSLPQAGGAGTLTYVLGALPDGLDPLDAVTTDTQTVTRQVHEPLAATATPPYGGERQAAGLATSFTPSPDRSVWTLELRPGVRFQDGTPFNAAAVQANSRRWASSPAGRRLLPGLFAVDAPRPNEVRFLLRQPIKNLPALLASPRLGIVSPAALKPSSGAGSHFRLQAEGTGTGPFLVSEERADSIELARNTAWWGTPAGLGPALDSATFTPRATAPERLDLLESGEVEVAQPFDQTRLDEIEADPLLSAVREVGGGVGMQASLRGIEAGSGLALLSGVWLTTIGG